MSILAALLKWISIAAVVAVVAGIGWMAFGEVNTAEAAQFDESMSMVRYQIAGTRQTLEDTEQFAAQNNVAEVTDINTLLGLWRPRYAAAQSAFTKLDSAIALAEQQADSYFIAQRDLTAQHYDPERKARWQAWDDAFFADYQAWQQDAHSIRDEASAILRELNDIDINLQKLELYSGFSFTGTTIDALPAEISSLDNELAEFDIASENIRATIRSPFEAQ